MTHFGPTGPGLPERIRGLNAVVANLSWSWNRDARALFRSIDQALWHFTQHNPIELLRRVDPARLAACAEDLAFLRLYDAVITAAARHATAVGTWFATSYPALVERPVAYFCAEFGLHNSVPIYSGGLGVLAGDHCKAASDLGVPLVGVGLFYTKDTPINGCASTGGRKTPTNASTSRRHRWSRSSGRGAIRVLRRS